MTGPERQCIGCGRRGPQSGFLRLAVDQKVTPARVVAADPRKSRGRGAYLCRRQACLDRALHRKAFQRVFRVPVAVEPEAMAALLVVEAGE